MAACRWVHLKMCIFADGLDEEVSTKARVRFHTPYGTIKRLELKAHRMDMRREPPGLLSCHLRNIQSILQINITGYEYEGV